MIVHKIDENGYIIEPVILNEAPYIEKEGELMPNPQYVLEFPPQPCYKPRWNGEEWIEEGQPPEPVPQEQPLELKNRADIDYISLMLGVEL